MSVPKVNLPDGADGHTPQICTSCSPAVKFPNSAYKRGFKSVASTASRLRKQTRPEGDRSKPKIGAITNACLRVVAGGSRNLVKQNCTFCRRFAAAAAVSKTPKIAFWEPKPERNSLSFFPSLVLLLFHKRKKGRREETKRREGRRRDRTNEEGEEKKEKINTRRRKKRS